MALWQSSPHGNERYNPGKRILMIPEFNVKHFREYLFSGASDGSSGLQGLADQQG
jgi:hypothetical protein